PGGPGPGLQLGPGRAHLVQHAARRVADDRVAVGHPLDVAHHHVRDSGAGLVGPALRRGVAVDHDLEDDRALGPAVVVVVEDEEAVGVEQVNAVLAARPGDAGDGRGAAVHDPGDRRVRALDLGDLAALK